MKDASQVKFTYDDPIEKSQWIFYGNFEHGSPQIQPSVHIGTQPVPALTTASLQGRSNSTFTDTSAMFEVVAEMEVEVGAPTPYPLYFKPHVTENMNSWQTTPPDTMTKSTYNGLHQI